MRAPPWHPDMYTLLLDLWQKNWSQSSIAKEITEAFPAWKITPNAVAGKIHRMRGGEDASGILLSERRHVPTAEEKQARLEAEALRKQVREEKRAAAKLIVEERKREHGISDQVRQRFAIPEDKDNRHRERSRNLWAGCGLLLSGDGIPRNPFTDKHGIFKSNSSITPKSFLDLKFNDCRWPIEHMGKTFYCGEPRLEGVRRCYCLKHFIYSTKGSRTAHGTQVQAG